MPPLALVLCRIDGSISGELSSRHLDHLIHIKLTYEARGSIGKCDPEPREQARPISEQNCLVEIISGAVVLVGLHSWLE